MTQLVAALCEDRTKVILVSDRMVATADDSLAFEHGPKFEWLSSNALVLSAGTVHEPELIEDARAEVGFKPSLSVSETLRIAYAAKERAEMAGGVGREIDAWMIDKEGCYEILHDTLQEIENLRQQETATQFRTQFEVRVKKLEYPTGQTRTS